MNTVQLFLRLILFCSFLVSACGSEEAFLQGSIDKIRQKSRKGVACAACETEYLELLNDHISPKDRAKILAAIARMYSENVGVNASNVLRYANQALRHPLDAEEACQLYVYMGNVYEIESGGCGKDHVDMLRREGAASYLKGLNLVLKYLEVESLKDLMAKKGSPRVDPFSVPMDDPLYEEMSRKHEEQVAAFDCVASQHKLLQLRDTLLERIRALYHGQGQESEEFGTLIDEIIPDFKTRGRIREALRKDRNGRCPQRP